MSRRRKALFFFLGLSLVLGLIAASIVAKVRRGEDLLWIAELWLPAAVFSIGMVVGIEYIIGPVKPRVETAPAPQQAVAKPKPKAGAKKSAKK